MKDRPTRWRMMTTSMVGLFLGGLLMACSSPPHLQRPLTLPSGVIFPPSIQAAERALAEAKAAGAANVQDARYPLARAEAFLLNAKEEFAESDPGPDADDFAKIALAAAQDALRIARQGR